MEIPVGEPRDIILEKAIIRGRESAYADDCYLLGLFRNTLRARLVSLRILGPPVDHINSRRPPGPGTFNAQTAFSKSWPMPWGVRGDGRGFPDLGVFFNFIFSLIFCGGPLIFGEVAQTRLGSCANKVGKLRKQCCLGHFKNSKQSCI